jgi:nitrogenase-stabilizing/protective protein
MSILDDLRKLSSAEDFFAYFKLDYDPVVLRVARLHIMRRMGEHIFARPPESSSDIEPWARYRKHLEEAYEEFARHTPLERRVFKVLKEAVSPIRLGLVQLKLPEHLPKARSKNARRARHSPLSASTESLHVAKTRGSMARA